MLFLKSSRTDGFLFNPPSTPAVAALGRAGGAEVICSDGLASRLEKKRLISRLCLMLYDYRWDDRRGVDKKEEDQGQDRQ